jgi:hypothetical protein
MLYNLQNSDFLVNLTDPARPILSLKSQALWIPSILVGLLPFENQKSASWQRK